MKTRKNSHKVPGKHRFRAGKAALPALVAAGGGLAVGSAAALELGELQVQSTLGQPLRASIAYALSPNEIIEDHCVAVRSGSRDLPGLHNTSVSVSKGVISISGQSPVMEPMLSANLVVDCPYSAHVSRSYLLFINPQDRPVTVANSSTAAATAATAPAERRSAAPRPVVSTTPISQDSRYLVQRGDSLSGIVQRLENRNVATADAMGAIVNANPGAFINGNPDRLKAGSWLDIPSFAGGVAPATAVTPPAAPVAPAGPRGDDGAVAQASSGASLYQGAETLEQDASKQIPATEFLPELPEPEVTEPVETAIGASEESAADEAAAESDYSAAYADLVAGDVVVNEPVAAEPPPAEPAAAPARVVNPSAGTRIVGSPQPAGSSWNWLIWATVALISAFGSYLMFWPRLRERFGSKPVGTDERVPPRSEHSAPHVAPISVPESEMTVQEIQPAYDNVDFDLSDDSPTEENLALDADLLDGTGFDDSEDVDVNRDFGFAATMDLDMELPENAAAEDPSPETDIIPPPERPEEELVVDSEVLPEEDEDEYDISMIVDATKMPDPAEVTERDLKAVPIEDTGQTLINDDYTIVDEIAQDILEQDYEDEMSATQLLNAEIEKAASDLADSLGEDDGAGEPVASDDDDAGKVFGSEDDTSIEMQLTNLSELDLTATLEAQNDEMSDDLDVTANIDAEDKTVEMPRDKDGTRAR
ncbi:MAG: hypothetical protein OEQ30_04150 [Gammaproteobacteria bacterium]|nr:hypothetical protein [Gammaproteobacteria bacterium]NCF60288.1 hypothetical protein [Gammaproteobacteria bacterium]